MDLALSEYQQMIQKTARDFLEKECPTDFVREMERDVTGFSSQLWQKMAELGWMGLMIPEEYGGTGGNFMDLIILIEEMGRACLPGPFFSNVILGAIPLLIAGNDVQKTKYLSNISSGNQIFTAAVIEADAKIEPVSIKTTALRDNDIFRINGVKMFVPDAHVSDFIICVARTNPRTNGLNLFITERNQDDINLTLLPTMACDKLYEVSLNGATCTADSILGNLDSGWSTIEELIKYAALAKCADMVGASRKVMEMTVDYALQRIQFDRPIGGFQAVQHHCANMLIELTASEMLTYDAVWKLAERQPCAKEASMAKAVVSDACARICMLGHRIHGGIGVTMEHDMQLYFRRVKAAQVMWGDSGYHQEAVAGCLGL